MPASPARRRIAILAAALPPLLLSAKLAHVLAAPLAPGNRAWVADGMALMLLEFFMVHAGFMSMIVWSAEGRPRYAIAAALGAFYLLFVGGFGFALGSTVIAASAALLLAGRFYAAAVSGRGELPARIRTSILAVIAYLVAVIGTSAPDAFPAFGFTREVLDTVRPDFGGSRGLWVEEPHRALAAGVAYFAAIGLFELARLRGVPGRPGEPG